LIHYPTEFVLRMFAGILDDQEAPASVYRQKSAIEPLPSCKIDAHSCLAISGVAGKKNQIKVKVGPLHRTNEIGHTGWNAEAVVWRKLRIISTEALKVLRTVLLNIIWIGRAVLRSQRVQIVDEGVHELSAQLTI
jgi:hypothetical protein